jgi:hypothetical protein
MVMKLNEEISRIKEVMGLVEQYPEEFPTNMNQDTSNEPIDQVDDNQTQPSQDKSDFSNSHVQDIVWRAGGLQLNPKRGGLWFAENKEDVEKFTMAMGGEKKVPSPYLINLQNPKYIPGFWHGYLGMVGYEPDGREKFMNRLIKLGYDGIIIDTDTWNDTADENSVTSKQFIVFNPENVRPV